MKNWDKQYTAATALHNLFKKRRGGVSKPMTFLKRKVVADDRPRRLGGEEGIWTLAPVTRPTPLAGEPLHHLSTSPAIQYSIINMETEKFLVWRRGRDSNPWSLSESLVFKTSSLNRSDTPPNNRQEICYHTRLAMSRAFLLLSAWWKCRFFLTKALKSYKITECLKTYTFVQKQRIRSCLLWER